MIRNINKYQLVNNTEKKKDIITRYLDQKGRINIKKIIILSLELVIATVSLSDIYFAVKTCVDMPEKLSSSDFQFELFISLCISLLCLYFCIKYLTQNIQEIRLNSSIKNNTRNIDLIEISKNRQMSLRSKDIQGNNLFECSYHIKKPNDYRSDGTKLGNLKEKFLNFIAPSSKISCHEILGPDQIIAEQH